MGRRGRHPPRHGGRRLSQCAAGVRPAERGIVLQRTGVRRAPGRLGRGAARPDAQRAAADVRRPPGGGAGVVRAPRRAGRLDAVRPDRLVVHGRQRAGQAPAAAQLPQQEHVHRPPPPLRRTGLRRLRVRQDVTMDRLPFPTRDDLDANGQEVWDSVTATRGTIVTGERTLMGPFNSWVIAPRIGGRLAELGAALRFESSVERRLLEVSIITVGAHWRAEFEWWAHSRMALHHGVSAEAVAAIAEGTEPVLPDDEAVVYA